MKPRLFAPLALLALLATGLALGTRAPQRPSPGELSAEQLARIEVAIQSAMARQKIPGLSAALVMGRALVWTKGFGLADVENSVPATPDSVYRLASVSKPLTAVAVLQLAERGRLDLDAPIQKYCPAFPPKRWSVTARQLLGHLGGIRHYTGPTAEAELANTRRFASVVEGLEWFKNDPLLHEPGTKFSYSTHGYNLLGCAVEGAAGMPYAAYVREHILRPTGMNPTRPDDVADLIPHRAQGYRKTPSGELRNSPLHDNSYKLPGGGWVSTAPDVARFAAALAADRLLKPDSLVAMWTPQKTRSGESTGYGLGWAVGERRGRREVWHTGGQQRVSTIVYLVPTEGFALVLLSNLEGADLTSLARKVADIVLD